MSETAAIAPCPELGHLIHGTTDGGADYSALLDFAKTQEIPVLNGEVAKMMGRLPITVEGQPAAIGWISELMGLRLLGAFTVEQDEKMRVLEGQVTAYVAHPSGEYISEGPEFDLSRGDKAFFRYPEGPDGKCWYLSMSTDLVAGSLPNGKSRFEAPHLAAWAQAADIPPYNEPKFKDALGEMPIKLLGRAARIGWMDVENTNDPIPATVLNPYPIERNERLTIFDGHVAVKIQKPDSPPQARNSTIGSYDFQSGDQAIFSNPGGGAQGRCWYLFTPYLGSGTA